MIGVNVEMTVKNNVTGEYLIIPVVPPTIQYTDGSPIVATVNVLNLGAIDFHNGVDLDAVNWDSFFPARYDPSYCSTSNLLDPVTYRNRFSSWKDTGASLQLIIPAAGINKNVKVNSFTWEYKGFEGDIYYSLTLKEAKTTTPKKIAVQVNGKTGKVTATSTPANRPGVPSKPTPKTYTVKPGDNLTKIAKTLKVNPWDTLYAKNKATIGPNPNKLAVGTVLYV